MKNIQIISILLIAVFLHTPAFANVSVPGIFSNNAVLQMGPKTPVWGWATPGEAVTVTLGSSSSASTVATLSGTWRVELPLNNANATPQNLVIQGNNTLTFSGVLVGEVWLCSGQSNMQWVLNSTIGATEEIAASANPLIRQFMTSFANAATPQTTAGGSWTTASPSTSGNFTGVGYYFAKKLQAELGVPVAIINSSVGGTPVEGWTSIEAFDWSSSTKAYRDDQVAKLLIQSNYATDYNTWITATGRSDVRLSDQSPYTAASVDASTWTPITLAGTTATTISGGNLPANGAFWARRSVPIASESVGKVFEFDLAVMGLDEVYWNGVRVSSMAIESYPGRGASRTITIPAASVLANNTLAIRIYSPVEIPTILCEASLLGGWLAKAEYAMPAVSPATVPTPPVMYDDLKLPRHLCSRLFNGMIHPWIGYGIRGANWYQGEANTNGYSMPAGYRSALMNMIQDWRRRWGQGDFFFNVCQLANYGNKSATVSQTQPRLSALRQAQLEATQIIPNTEIANLIDLGEVDIHPRNKKDVGDRLAFNALAKVYSRVLIHRGPRYQSKSIEGTKIRITFDHVDLGLVAKPVPATHVVSSSAGTTATTPINSPGSQLQGFAIRGATGNWVWANASIDGNTVLVESPTISSPVDVMYALENNPTCNLYNGADFPALPFTTQPSVLPMLVEGVEASGQWVQGTTRVTQPGSSRALIVMLHGEGANSISASSVTYGGRPMSKVVEKSHASAANSHVYAGAFCLNEAGIAAATSGNIAVTWTSTPTLGSEVTSAFYTNVEQVTPSSTASNGLSDKTITTPPLATSEGDLVLLGASAQNNHSYKADNYFIRGIPETSAGFGDVTASFKYANGSAETPSVTLSEVSGQALIGFVLKETAASPVPAYTLTTAGTNGTVTLNPPGGIYDAGTVVTVTATPDNGYTFGNWSGDLTGASSTTTLTMTGNKDVTAHFLQNVELTELTGWVTGTSNPKVSGANRLMTVMVMGESSGDFSATSVTYGGQTMDKRVERLFFVSGNRTYAAMFTLGEVGVNAATSGTIAVTWSTTPTSGSAIYSVLLSGVDQANPISSTQQTGLSGTTIATSPLSAGSGDLVIMGGATESNTTLSFNNGFTKQFESNTSWGDATGGRKLGVGAAETPSFTQSASGRMVLCAMLVKAAPTFSLTTTASNGAIVLNPPGGVYSQGQVVAVTAIPDTGYRFANWSGSLAGSVNPTSVTMNESQSITANFTAIPTYTLTTVGANGAVTLNPPGGTYNEGTVVTVTATPDSGFTFNGWTGDLTGSVNPTTITMDGNKNVTANFAAMAHRAWTAAGADANWSTAANWSMNSAPSGSSGPVIFSGNTKNTSSNDLTGITFGSFTFANDGSPGRTNGFVLNGSNAISLSNNTNTTAIMVGGSAITDTINLNVILSGTRIFNTNSNHHLTINGDISESIVLSGLTKQQSATLTLSGNNVYTGTTIINGGTLSISRISDTVSGSNIGFGNLRIGDSGTTGILNYTGSGSTTTRTVRIGNGTATTHAGGAIISANGGNGGTGLKFTATAFNPVDSAATAAARTLTLRGSNTDANTIAGEIRNVNGAPTLTNLTKTDAGLWILGGANTYTGPTAVSGGVLQLDNASALGSGSLTLGGGVLGLGAGNFTRSLGPGPMQVQITADNSGFAAYGADRIVNLGGASIPVGVTWATPGFFTSGSSLVLGHATATHTLDFQNPVDLNGAGRTFEVSDGAADIDAILSGVVSSTGLGTTPSFVKTGAGTMVISGINTYPGATTVSSGTLRLGGNNALPDTSSIRIAAGTLDVSTFADDAGTLDVTGAATIHIGSGGKMAFANSSSIDWAGGSLNITGTMVTGSSIRFGTSPTGLTTTQLGLISVNGSPDSYLLDANGYLVDDAAPDFLTWSEDERFDMDLNEDGIKNGIAWLLGAPNLLVSANSFMPVVTEAGDGLKMNFNMLPAHERNGAELCVEYSSDLGVSDPWIAVPVPDATSNTAPVSFSVSGTNPLAVEVNIAPNANVDGRLFARLRAKSPPSSPATQFFKQGAHELVVYRDVPGMTPSNHYRIRVRSAATNWQWQYAFPLITRNLWSQATIPKSNGNNENYYKHTRDWSHTYANIEMNSPVEIEIYKSDGTPIAQAAAHPVAKASPVTLVNGRAYLTLANPVAITVDVDGQMDGQYTGRGYTGPAIHTVSVFAHPLMEKPSLGSPGVVEVKAGDTPPLDPSTYNTLYFSEGVHNVGRNFKVHAFKNYYIGGDAIVYGTLNNVGTGGGKDIKIYGLGTLSGDRINHPSFDPQAPNFDPPGVDENGSPMDPTNGYSPYVDEVICHEWKPISTENSEQVILEGICVANPANHAVNLRSIGGMTNANFRSQTFVNWAKVISWRGNGDGIGSAHEVENCFIRTADDCSYLKGNRRKCIFWTDTNGAVFHMAGIEERRPIVAEDCDVIYARASWNLWDGGRVFSQRGEGTKGQQSVNLTVRNFRVTDPYPTYSFFQLYSIKPNSGPDVEPGSSFSGIRFEDITVKADSYWLNRAGAPQTGSFSNLLHGHVEAPWSNITFKNVMIAGQKLDGLEDFQHVNEHVTNIIFE